LGWVLFLNRKKENCSLSSGSLETASDLEGVVDPPLESGEGSHHEDSGTKSVPETLESDFLVDLSHGATSLVDDGDHGVSGVRHNSAEDTSPVSGQESDHELGVLGVVRFSLGEDVGVHVLDSGLEGGELHNSVGDLSHPERLDSLVHGGPATLSEHDRPCFSKGLGEGANIRGLHSDLDLYIINKKKISRTYGLHGAQKAVGNDFSAG
jgi:hypothetical protein